MSQSRRPVGFAVNQQCMQCIAAMHSQCLTLYGGGTHDSTLQPPSVMARAIPTLNGY